MSPLVYIDNRRQYAKRPYAVSWRDGALVCIERFATEQEARRFAAGESHPRAGTIRLGRR